MPGNPLILYNFYKWAVHLVLNFLVAKETRQTQLVRRFTAPMQKKNRRKFRRNFFQISPLSESADYVKQEKCL